MRFAAGIWLWLLPLLPLLLGALLRWNDRRAAGRLRALLGERAAAHVEGEDRRLRTGRRFLLLSGLLCLILALARPQWGAHDVVVKERGTDVVVALDISNSMLAEDVPPSRLERAKNAVGAFLDGLDRGRVGLVLFAGAAYVQCPLTLDYGTARLFLAQASPDMITAQGTALGAALATSRELLERGGGPGRSGAERAILLVTDGEDFEGNVEQEAARCRDAGIVIFPAGVGDPRGGLIPRVDATGRPLGFQKDDQGAVVLSRPDPAVLSRLAEATGGALLQLGATGLDLARLRRLLERLGERELEERRISAYEERFVWPLGLALLCLLAREAWRPRRARHAAGRAAGRAEERAEREAEPQVAAPGAAVLPLALALLLLAAGAAVPARAESPLRPAGAAEADRGRALYRDGKYAEALQAFEAARALNPDDARLTLAVGETLARLERAEEAGREFQRALAQADDVDLRAEGLYNAGTARLGLGDPAGAVRLLRQALSLAPDRNDARHNLELAQRRLEQQQDQQPQKDDQQQQRSEQEQQQEQSRQQQDGKGEEQKQQPEQQQGQQQQGQSQPPSGQQEPEQQSRPPEGPAQTPQQQRPGEDRSSPEDQSAYAGGQQKGSPEAMSREEALGILRALDRDELELRRSVQKRLRGGANRSGKSW